MNAQTSQCFHRVRTRLGASLLVLAVAGLLPAVAAADAAAVIATADSDTWKFSATVYGWFPDIHSTVHFPVLGTTQSVSVDANKLYSNLNLGFTGAFDVHYGHWGAFTDIIYLNLGAKKSNSRDFTIGDVGIPANTTADLRFSMKSWIVTIAPEYRLSTWPEWTVDLLAGGRYADLTTSLNWSFTGNIGPLPPVSRVGGAEAGIHFWTGIVGIKGQYALGSDKRWSVPFYFDAGSGNSWRTYQAAGGVGYSFHWGEITALYRYLDYKPQSSIRFEEVYFAGPLVGATFRW